MRQILVVALIVVLAILLFQNRHDVVLSFLIWHTGVPLPVLLLLTVLAGALIGLLLQPRRKERDAAAHGPHYTGGKHA